MNLIYPSASHMDFNIASALKYSAEGKGFELSTDFFEEKGFKEFLDLMDKFVSEKQIEEVKTTSYDEGMITKKI